MSRSNQFRNKKAETYDKLVNIYIDWTSESSNNLPETQKKTHKYVETHLKNIINKIENPNLIKNNNRLHKSDNFSWSISKNNITSLENKLNINLFKKINVPGDGTCGYHAIIKSFRENYGPSDFPFIVRPLLNGMKNSNKKIYSELIQKNINKKNNEINGFLLRKMLVSFLEGIPEKYLVMNFNKTLSNDNMKKYNMYSNIIKPISLLTNSKYQNINDLSNIPLRIRINKMIETIKDKDKWIDEDVLLLTASALNICINIFDAERKRWMTYSPNSDSLNNRCSLLYNSFILYNGENHYDALVKYK